MGLFVELGQALGHHAALARVALARSLTYPPAFLATSPVLARHLLGYESDARVSPALLPARRAPGVLEQVVLESTTMRQDTRRHDDREVQGGQRRDRPAAPGKVTPTSKLDRAPVQRQPAGTARSATRARDPDMDAWMDAAHRGAAAAPPAGAAVQRQDTTGGGGGAATATTAPSKVKLTIEWRGQFGADISARLRVQGRNGKADWVTLVKDVEVTDADGTAGAASDKLSHTVEVDRHGEYQVTFSPVAEAPDDRYRDTSTSVRVGATAPTATLAARLDLNRWNRKNVDDVWKGRNIDPDKADDVVSASLFGRTVNVHKAVVPRVAQTNALYEALDGATKQAIRDSLFVTGGYAVRTTSEGKYSNHSGTRCGRGCSA